MSRLLGSFYLMLHLDGICKEAASLLLSKIATGHFFSTAIAFLANVARIRSVEVVTSMSECKEGIL